MPGTLYLIPNLLGAPATVDEAMLAASVPETVLADTAKLSHFIAENAKTTRAYLKLVSRRVALAQPLQEIQITELNVNTEAGALPALLEPLLQGTDAGLISEAGVPAVADPGANLVRLAHARGIRVKPLIGPSSLLLAVMAGGLNGQSFAFHGYLPIDAAQRQRRIRELEERSRKESQTQLFIETPYRNAALLEALTSSCQPGTLISVATDLSLPDESIQTRTVGAWKSELRAGRMPAFHKKPTVFSMLAQ